jgi:hypothetical protein
VLRQSCGSVREQSQKADTGFGPHLASSRALHLHPFGGYVRSSEFRYSPSPDSVEIIGFGPKSDLVYGAQHLTGKILSFRKKAG